MTIRGTLLAIGALFWLAALGCWLRSRGSWRLSREGMLFLLLGIPFVVAGGFYTASSYPQVAPPTPTPVPIARPLPADPTPAPTPRPRAQKPTTYAETVAASQREAVARYPDLGIAGTEFNSRFVAAYRRLREEDPGYFIDPAWPLRLADELARPAAKRR